MLAENPTWNRCKTRCTLPDYDALLFGPGSRGLPPEVLAQFDTAHRLRLPMLPGSRSMNLFNTVSVVVFEAWR